MLIKTSFRTPIKQALKLLNRTKAKIFYQPKSCTEFLENHWSACTTNIGDYLLQRAKTRSIYDPSMKEDIIRFYDQNPVKKSDIISNADRICQHIFNVLGSENIDLGEQINWHKDYVTDYQWNPQTFYTDIATPYDRADIKFPWELSRFQQLITLGESYVLTKDEKYTKEFIDQISDWIEQNPYQYGVNWHCSMDIALRVVNWTVSLFFFLQSPLINDEFLAKLLNSIYHHGRHIRSNLEYNPIATGNHYLSNLLGLLCISCHFPEFTESKNWKKFALQELRKEMSKQVYPDGTHYEASTCYHRLVTEIFFYSTLMTVINHPDFRENNYVEIGNKIFGKNYIKRLQSMFSAILHLLKPDGRMPQIGDNDNGRIYAWAKRDTLDMRYLLCLGSIFFNDPMLKITEFGFHDDALWIYSPKSWKELTAQKTNTLKNIVSRAFPDSGWYVMRRNNDYMIVSCGPNGRRGLGTHAHNDKLSFELMINGKDCIIDPGTCTYSANIKLRNEFRSTAFHNTLRLDNKEQNPILTDLWILPDATRARVTKWENSLEKDVLIAQHQGFGPDGIHEREIIFEKCFSPRWKIIDRLNGKGEHTVAWTLNFAPGTSADSTINSESIPWQQQKGLYSPEYGRKSEISRYTAILTTTLPNEFSFTIGKDISE